MFKEKANKYNHSILNLEMSFDEMKNKLNEQKEQGKIKEKKLKEILKEINSGKNLKYYGTSDKDLLEKKQKIINMLQI